VPGAFLDLAVRADADAGFAHYDPDACLINRYIAGAKLGLHQDRDEKDAWAPIVSVSFGLPAVFLWGGKRRSDPVRRIRLESGDMWLRSDQEGRPVLQMGDCHVIRCCCGRVVAWFRGGWERVTGGHSFPD
jgi:DNA alkylation damage repair protein AlkB